MLSAKTETGEVLNRGLAIYERYIAPRLNVEDEGRYVAVDMNSGEVGNRRHTRGDRDFKSTRS